MEHLQKAWQLMDSGQLFEAEQLYLEVAQSSDPDSPEYRQARFGLGYVYASAGRFHEARSCYHELLKQAEASNNRNAQHRMLHQLGMVERMAQNLERSLEFFRQEAALLPNDPLARSANHYEQGHLNVLLKRLDEAETLLVSALQEAEAAQDQTAAGCALRGLGELWRARGDKPKAREMFTLAEEAFRDAGDDAAAEEVLEMVERF